MLGIEIVMLVWHTETVFEMEVCALNKQTKAVTC